MSVVLQDNCDEFDRSEKLTRPCSRKDSDQITILTVAFDEDPNWSLKMRLQLAEVTGLSF